MAEISLTRPLTRPVSQYSPAGSTPNKNIVIPDGCVNIPGSFELVHPYANFSQWCRDHEIDLLVFGWDWRRSVQEAADFFLKIFLPMFDARFGGQTPHPLDHFTLIGHSAGGMVVKAILNSTADQYVQRVKRRSPWQPRFMDMARRFTNT